MNPSASKRLFTALTLPLQTREHLFYLTSEMKKSDNDICVIPVQNIHLTLKFLGDVPVEKIKKILQVLRDSTNALEKARFKLAGKLGGLPRAEIARIIYCGLEAGESTENVEKVFKITEKSLFLNLRVPRESRKFLPHITVGRLREKKDLISCLSEARVGIKDYIDCKKITLFESILKPTGSEYVIIEEFDLK